MRLAWLAAAVAVAACDDEVAPFVPPSFERADQVAFACVDTVREVGVPLAECEVQDVPTELRS